eukprot:2679302-Rhodomonas_salina.2
MHTRRAVCTRATKGVRGAEAGWGAARMGHVRLAGAPLCSPNTLSALRFWASVCSSGSSRCSALRTLRS